MLVDCMSNKVFGLGLQRTGTTTLRVATATLGLSTVPSWRWMGRFSDNLKRGNVLADALDLANRYDACINMPFPTFYRELYDAHPDAKFILTLRDDESWYESMTAFFGSANWPEIRYVFGQSAAPDHKERMIETYHTHNHTVLEFFADKPGSLLLMDINSGKDGWKTLCDFLGRETEYDDFPKSNEKESLRAQFVMRCVPAIATTRRALGISDRIVSGRKLEP